VLCSFLLGCGEQNAIIGNGRLTMEERSIEDFSVVDVVGNEAVAFVYCPHNLIVQVHYADIANVQIRADENLSPYIQVKNDGPRLRIELLKALKSNQDITIFVSKPFEKLASQYTISTTSSGCAEIIWSLGAAKTLPK
jgi:hypothetical protein